MEITDELVGLAKKAKSAEEIKSLAKDKGYDISDDEATRIYEFLHKSGELSEEELSNVSGGGCKDGGSSPKYSVGSIVTYYYMGWYLKFRVTYVTPKKVKFGVIFKDSTWAYDLECVQDPSGYKGKIEKNVPEYSINSISGASFSF